MAKKIEIKEEDPLTDDIASENERMFFQNVVYMKTSTDDVLLDTDCDMTVKPEIKSETTFVKESAKQIKTETATSNYNCEVDSTNGVEQNEGEFLSENPIIMDNKYNSDHKMCNKIEIKVETWQLHAETSVWDNTKDGDLSVTSSRLHPESFAGATNDKLPLLLAEVPARETSFSNGIGHLEYKKCNVSDVRTAKELHSDQYAKCNNEANRYIQPSNLKHRSLSYLSKSPELCDICGNFSCLSHLKPHQCNTCDKSFARLYHLKRHVLSHEGKKSYHCKVCNGSFTRLSYMKIHIAIHEGKKPHQCKVCNKSFTRLSALKTHTLIHEGKKMHQCQVCNKSFTHLTTLKSHNLVHEGKKPHQCKVCNKSFTQLSNLKTHNLVHEGKKPHHCKLCDKGFTQLSNMKKHNLVHEGKKPHQCKVCNKSFTELSGLKRHSLVHEDKKPHQCKVCNKSFTELSKLKRHTFVHEGKKPHQCKVCNKSFTDLSALKRHNLVHEDKKPHQCKLCDKSFPELWKLKRHNLVHEGKKQHKCIYK